MKPWGYKVTIYIYVEGEEPNALVLAEATAKAAKTEHADRVGFVGASMVPVQGEPEDQVAT